MAMTLQPSRLRLTQAIYFGKPQIAVGSGFVRTNGTTPLTADWNAGNFKITSRNSTDWYNVVAYGAVPGGGDCRAAVVAAISACEAAGGGVVYFPGGTFTVNQVGAAVPFVITSGNVFICGAGRSATNINFVPATGGAVFQFNNGAVPINYCGIQDISFRSADTTTQKTMVLAYDLNNFIIERVSNTAGTAWTGGAGIGSIGVQFKGRQELRMRDCEITADQPVYIDLNPNHPISFDHSSVESCDLLATGLTTAPSTYHNPSIRINDAAMVISNAVFRNLACVGGNGAIYANTTLAASAWFAIEIDNVRTEQQDTGGGHTTEYDIDIRCNQAVQGLSVSNVFSSGLINGMRLANAKWPLIDSFTYGGVAGTTSVNLAATVNGFCIRNSFFQSGSTVTDASTAPVAISHTLGGNPPFTSIGTLSPSTVDPLSVGSTSQMKVTAAGQIGLGGATPDQALTLAVANQHFIGGAPTIYSEPAAPGAATISFNALASGAAGYLANGASMRLESDAANSGVIRFATTEAGVGNFERVTIDKQGHVGVATTTPTRTIDLNGTQRYRGIAAPAVSEANSGTIYFDSAANKLKVSLNGGAYVDLVGSGGLTGSGALPKIAYWDSATSLNAPLIYVDPATSFLGIGVAVPLYAIDVIGDINLSTGSVVRVNAGTVFQTIAASASTAIGGVNGTLSTSDTAIGAAALAVSTGGGTGFNTMVGSSAGQALTTGNHNTGIGAAVLVATTIGTKNVAIGDAAGGTNTTGTNNIFIGSGADATVGNLNHACAIGTGASIADSNALNIGGGIQKVGIATSTPKCAFDVNGAVAMRQLTVTLVNGLNSDITSLVQSSWWRIEGPTGGFSVGGFALGSSGVSDGMILCIYNSTAQQMTIVNEDASSTAIKRIKTLTGGNVVLRAGTSAATFRYDSVDDRWILCSQN